MKFKRMFCLVVTVCMLFSLFITGCNKEKLPIQSTTTTTTETSQIEDNPTVPEKHVNLTWYNIADEQEDQELVMDAVNKILKEKLNVTLNYNVVNYGSFDQKMMLIEAGQEEYDISYVSSWTHNYSNAVSKGAIIPLDDLLQQYGKNILKKIDSRYMDAVRIPSGSGKIYAVINEQFFGRDNGIWFKKDLVDKYQLQDQIDQIKTMEDLEPILATIKENEPGILTIGEVFTIPLKEETREYDKLDGTPFIVYRDDPEFKLHILQEEPWAISLNRLKRDWYNKGYISADAVGITDFSSVNKRGKVFCGFTTSKPGVEIEMAQNYGFDVIVKSGFTTPVIDLQNLTATMSAISATSKNPERAMMLLDLMYEDKELYNMFCWGLEGVHYNKVGENIIETTPEFKRYFPNNAWAVGSNLNAYLTTMDDPNRWEETRKLNEDAVFTPFFGFVPDLKDIRTEMAQITAVMKTYGQPMNTGSVETDEINDKYLKELKASGVEKVREEIQRQVDVFREAKKTQK